MLNLKKLMSTFVKNSLNIFFFNKKYMKIRISGESMHPNFLEGETYILKKTKSINFFNRFEPIIYFCKIHNKLHLKRLLAFSNEKLEIRKGKLYIDNRFINYHKFGSVTFNILVCENSFFTFSDNFMTRGKNCDSFSVGSLNNDVIVGRILD
ncbi:MAG: signal peptidase I [Dehalococcoidia bacterium]|nr:signal peptidase I [Dehalococcoidia bacterium]